MSYQDLVDRVRKLEERDTERAQAILELVSTVNQLRAVPAAAPKRYGKSAQTDDAPDKHVTT